VFINSTVWSDTQQQLKAYLVALLQERGNVAQMAGQMSEVRLQVADRDKTILKLETDIAWLRSRLEALERERVILLRETTHLQFPVPDAPVPKIPTTLPALPADVLEMFEDVGDERAQQLGIKLDDDGNVNYTK
jgi:hypothetical protein